jgi:hypothetical protein
MRHCPSASGRYEVVTEGKATASSATVTGCTDKGRGAGYLQDGELSGSDDKDGCEHEPNTGSEHGRGCK